MEGIIEKTKKENADLIKRIRNLKNMQVFNSKELEILNINKKYPNQINIYTDEIKNQVAKKHEYFSKLNKNKKSITNMKTLLTRTIKYYNDLPNPIKQDKSNLLVVKAIEETINSLNKELGSTEEEIIDKINNNNSPYSNLMDYNVNNENKKLNYKIITNNRSPKNTNAFILPKIVTNNKSYNNIMSKRSISPNKHINSSNKGIYTNKGLDIYNNNNNNVTNRNSMPHYMNNNNSGKIVKNEINDNEIQDLEYENVTDTDFSNLLKKKEQLLKVGETLLKNIKEVDKLHEKKMKDLKSTVEHNTRKLQMLQQVKK
jgi:hypothetical protein